MKKKTTKSKNILKKALVYLAGAIDNASDHGIEWRTYFRSQLKKRNIKLTILDPTKKIGSMVDEVKEKKIHLALKKNHEWKKLSKYMKAIVRKDLRQVDFSDFLVVKIDPKVHTCGTYSEIQIADLQHKPILVIIDGGRELAPSWLFGILDYRLMFDNEDECLDYLDRVNRGKIILDDKWFLIRNKIN